MILQAKGLSFGYKKEKPLLKDFQLRLESGERTGILAPSGFGKTTLCQLLAGYLAPWQGQVLLDGREISQYRGYCPVQMIWQHPEKSLNPRLRMKEVITESGGVGEAVLTGLGIEKDWYGRFPMELSGGELQRFCIARALGPETKFLIADEISTMLDMITQSQIWQFLLQEVVRRKIGLLVVSHSEALISRVCTHTVDLTSLCS